LFALSIEHNPRNTEREWYPFWNHVLAEWLPSSPEFVVSPQYAVWLPRLAVAEHDGNYSEEASSSSVGGSIPFTAPIRIPRPRAAKSKSRSTMRYLNPFEESDVDEESEENPANVSFSSIKTQAEPNVSQQYVDFAILKYTHKVNVVLLAEIKRGPRRTDPIDFTSLESRMVQAKNQVAYQAALMFLKNPEQECVRAIAAAGAYWSTATLFRENIELNIWKTLEVYHEFQMPQLKHVNANWSNYIKVDETDSQGNIQRVKEELINF
jgi:hypothetical protein